jgi:hypothetical protein
MLHLRELPDGSVGATGDEVRVPPGTVGVLAAADPAGLLAAVAGVAPGPPRVHLGGGELSSLSAVERSRSGLAVATARPPAAFEGVLLDVVLLGSPPGGNAPRSLLAVAAGTARARTDLADAEAAARALAGRLGLARWLAVPPAAAPSAAIALADLARALLGAPRALVSRRPDWLDPIERSRITVAVEQEAARLGTAVLWVTGVTGETGEDGSTGAVGERR